MLASFVSLAQAQSNEIKGRVIGLPGCCYSVGLGYENHFSKRFSGQLLFVKYGSNLGADASTYATSALIPELKVYLLKKKRWSPFAGVFFEKVWKSDSGGGECEVCESSKSWENNVGLDIGQNLPLGKRFGLEFYGGPKWRNGTTETQTYYVLSNLETNETADYQKFGWRLGWNIRFIF